MVKPRDHQLKAAAQAHFLFESPFKGLLLGDGKGMGKTLTYILAMYQVKDEPGFSMVVAPEQLCGHWVNEIQAAFQEGHGLTTHLFDASSPMTAHDLRELDVDVVIASYDQVEAAQRDMRTFRERIDQYRRDTTGLVPLPKRPVAALHSGMWRDIGLPIKRLVLDEVHKISDRSDVRHQAVKALYYKAVIQLSGRLWNGKWEGFSGYVDFLSGHPFPTHEAFIKGFSTVNEDGKISQPNFTQTRMLLRFLQAFTIARPSSILPSNSGAQEVKTAGAQKDAVMSELMEALVRRPDQGPDIRPLYE